MKELYKKARGWYENNESRVSSFFLLFGFVVDALTLRRVDLLRENIWILGNILTLAICIILVNRIENKRATSSEEVRQHFWTTNIMQFAIGNQLGSITVFYFKSGAISSSWPFFLLILGAVIANEVFRKHLTRLVFHCAFLYISIFSFLIFIVPVLMHKIGVAVFLLSGVLSLVVFYIFIQLLRIISRERLRSSRRTLAISTLSIYALINFLYFTNMIPPIPLALKDGGVYHSVSKDAQGRYLLEGERRGRLSALDFFKDLHLTGGPVYAYSAVFAPTNLDTTIVHAWEYFDEERVRWVRHSKVGLEVKGGSTGGWRTFSVSENIFPGRWRVSVETPRGQVMGYIRFDLVNGGSYTRVTEVK